MLEETGLPYQVHGVNLRLGEQFKPDFLKIAPNNRIPAIVDHDGPSGEPLSLFESGAILIYLAEKTGKFLPANPQKRYATLQWLMWQMGGIGPIFGQCNHFLRYAVEKIQYAIDRYTKEANRLTYVLDKRLSETRFVVGDEYSIADIAIFPWVRGAERRGIDITEYPNVQRWFGEINARPAVVRGLQVLASDRTDTPPDAKARDVMFGDTQFKRR